MTMEKLIHIEKKTPPTAENWENWFHQTLRAWERQYSNKHLPPSVPSEESAPLGVGYGYGSHPALLCPVCGFEYVHPVGLTCQSAGRANTRLRVDAEGIHQDPLSSPSGRGVRITVEFLCESGHRFDYSFQFHKGWTFIEREANPQALEVDQRPQTIWRN